MNREEYLKLRNSLYEEAQKLIDEGKIEEANKKIQEIQNLDNNFEVASKAQANLNALENNISIPAPIVNKVVDKNNAIFVGEGEIIDEKEVYLYAWAKYMQGKQLENQEKEIFDRVNSKNDFHLNNTAMQVKGNEVLIPETVVAGIWREAGETYPLFGDVVPTYIQGDMTIIKEINTGDDAAWYDEATKVEDSEVEFGEINLKGCELAKSITVSWKLRKMAIKEFIPYITTILAEKMGAALAKAIYAGKGQPGTSDSFKAQPLGIKTALEAENNTPQVITYAKGSKVGYDDLTAAMSKISKYFNGAYIYANNDMIWNQLAQIKDAMERPLFIPDATSGGVGRILGKIVKEDDSIGTGELFIGNVKKGYAMNINENVSLYTEEHVKERTTDYMSYSIVDGTPITTKAFALIKEATA